MGWSPDLCGLNQALPCAPLSPKKAHLINPVFYQLCCWWILRIVTSQGTQESSLSAPTHTQAVQPLLILAPAADLVLLWQIQPPPSIFSVLFLTTFSPLLTWEPLKHLLLAPLYVILLWEVQWQARVLSSKTSTFEIREEQGKLCCLLLCCTTLSSFFVSPGFWT